MNEAVGGVVSCGEMEFYRNAAPVAGLTEVFADELCSELRADVDQRKIDGLENSFFRMIAQSLYDKTYDWSTVCKLMNLIVKLTIWRQN